MKRRKHRTRILHNASIPFNSLPTEIGHRIFSISLRGEIISAYYTSLFRLRHVCALWSNSIDAEPFFWTVLYNRPTGMPWQHIITKSQHSSLIVSFQDIKDVGGEAVGLPRAEFLDIAARQIHRIKALCFNSSHSSAPLTKEDSYTPKSLLALEAPLLEVLQIRADDPHPGVEIETKCKS